MNYIDLISEAQQVADSLDGDSPAGNAALYDEVKDKWRLLKADTTTAYKLKFLACHDNLERGNESACYLMTLLRIDLTILKKLNEVINVDKADTVIEKLFIRHNKSDDKKKRNTPLDGYVEFCEEYTTSIERLANNQSSGVASGVVRDIVDQMETVLHEYRKILLYTYRQ